MFKNLKETELFVVLNEESLTIMKNKVTGKPLKFKTEKDADRYASGRLEVWLVIKVHFVHKFISHKV